MYEYRTLVGESHRDDGATWKINQKYRRATSWWPKPKIRCGLRCRKMIRTRASRALSRNNNKNEMGIIKSPCDDEMRRGDAIWPSLLWANQFDLEIQHIDDDDDEERNLVVDLFHLRFNAIYFYIGCFFSLTVE